MYSVYLGWFVPGKPYTAEELLSRLQELDKASRRFSDAGSFYGGVRWLKKNKDPKEVIYPPKMDELFKLDHPQAVPQKPEGFSTLSLLVDSGCNQFFLFSVRNGKYVYLRSFQQSPGYLIEGMSWGSEELREGYHMEYFQGIPSKWDGYKVIRPTD